METKKLISYIKRHREFLNLSAIAEIIGCNSGNFTMYLYTKNSLPEKYVPKLNSLLFQIGAREFLDDEEFMLSFLKDGREFLNISGIAELIDCDRHNFHRFIFKENHLPAKHVRKLYKLLAPLYQREFLNDVEAILRKL